MLVAIPAVSYNGLRMRIDLLESETYSDVAVRRARHFGVIQKFPLAARLSKTSFLIAAPILAGSRRNGIYGVLLICNAHRLVGLTDAR